MHPVAADAAAGFGREGLFPHPGGKGLEASKQRIGSHHEPTNYEDLMKLL